MIFKVSGSHDWTLREDQIAIWLEQFPYLDVKRELLKMQAWCEANPSRRKKVTGMKRFIVNWLLKADGERVQRLRHEDRTRRAQQIVPYEWRCPHPPPVCRTPRLCYERRDIEDAVLDGRITQAQADRFLAKRAAS